MLCVQLLLGVQIMAHLTTVNARIDAQTKAKVTAILKSLGITTSQAISMYFRQIIYRHGIPFEATLPTVPSKRALKAIADVEAGKNLIEVANPDEFMRELEK
jgi:DNA-damage-inducible protein J